MYYAALEAGENINPDEDLILSVLRTQGKVIFEDRGSFAVSLRNEFLGINTTKIYGQDQECIDDAILLANELKGGVDLINYSRWHVDPTQFDNVFNISGRQEQNITRSYIGSGDEIMPFFVAVKGISYPPKNAYVIENAGHWDMSKNPYVLSLIGNDIKSYYN